MAVTEQEAKRPRRYTFTDKLVARVHNWFSRGGYTRHDSDEDRALTLANALLFLTVFAAVSAWSWNLVLCAMSRWCN